MNKQRVTVQIKVGNRWWHYAEQSEESGHLTPEQYLQACIDADRRLNPDSKDKFRLTVWRGGDSQ